MPASMPADEQVSASVKSPVAIRFEFSRTERNPDERVDSESKIELGREGLPEIVRHSVSLDPNILKALKRSALDVDLHL